MSWLSRKQQWLLTTGLAAGASALAVHFALPRAWHAATGEDPPVDPSRSDTAWSEALLWTVAAGVVSSVAGLVARRTASEHLAGAKPEDTFK